MGHKRRNLPRRSKPLCSKPPQSAGGESSNSQLTGGLPQEQRNTEPFDFASIKAELDQANTIFHSRNEAKGLRLVKDICRCHKNCAIAYHLLGNIHAFSATKLPDNAFRQRHFKAALEEARKAVSLSKNSIEFTSFHANMIFQSATDSRGCEEAAREGERALSIENPIDPATQSLCPGKFATADERMEGVLKELCSQVQRYRNASLSGSGKNLGEGIVLKPVIVDPVRRNKIVKQTKIPEERL